MLPPAAGRGSLTVTLTSDDAPALAVFDTVTVNEAVPPKV
jgi:hypothetical protein